MRGRNAYEAFGTLLAALRVKVGISHQSDLARLVKSTQQTVSRWEAGLSRPRDKQIPLLAKVLNINADELFAAAGYSAKKAVATFDHPFPIDALNPDSFQRFCLHFLAAMYPDAAAHPAGGQGHAQDGLDIEVVFSVRKRHTFQCKRVETFGPDKVHAAVAAHTAKAQKKYLLLSRTASPKARDAVRQHKDWDIWDREDISLKIRQLPRHEQIRLVDIFFRGQRLALLGETERGPWQTREEFFAPFAGSGAFNHAWQLIGRTDETQALIDGLGDSTTRIVILIGAGGSGKSRILKQAVEQFEANQKHVLLRFLSPTEAADNKSLEDLGDREKVLVVDDAHDRDDLQLLFQYAASGDNVTLLLSLRPYGLDYVKAQASSFSLADDRIREVRVIPLALADATALAKQVLEKLGGPVDLAEDIAKLTRDCPLATVIGAQVIVKERIPYELVKHEATFRSTLMGKFRDVIAGNIGNKSDTEPIKKLLLVLALAQPFHPEDRALAQMAERVEGLQSHKVSKLVRLLTDAGVLFKRGGAYRLSPDLLADYIIEIECIGPEGQSTGYAELAFDAATGALVEHVLLNLGKLDWRRANGDPSNSTLLRGIWAKLKPTSEYADPHIKAVTSVAYYQPVQALDFVERQIREGKFLRDLPRIAKYAAYSYSHLNRACECLWELGSDNNKELNQNPDHGIRVLSELCAVEPNKPIAYNEVVVDFALALLEKPEAWTKAYSPFDVLEGILHADGHTTTSNGRTISWNRFQVNRDAVAALRAKVVDAAIRLLAHQNPKVGVLAARCLQHALTYPMDGTKEVQEGWTAEFIQTLRKIASALKSQTIDPLVHLAIGRTVSWHANYSERATTKVAKQIIAAMPTTLLFRTMLALTGTYEHPLKRIGDEAAHKKWQADLKLLVAELSSQFPEAEARRAFIEQTLSHMQADPTRANPHGLYWLLVNASDDFARATIDDASARPSSKTSRFVSMALAHLLRQRPQEALAVVQTLLAAGRTDLSAGVGNAFSGVDYTKTECSEDDIAVLKLLLESREEDVVFGGIAAVKAIGQGDKRLAIRLLHHVDLGLSSKVTDDALSLFYSDKLVPFALLDKDDVQQFLDKLAPLPHLEGYWIDTFLANVSKNYSSLGADFFIGRVEHAATDQSWTFRACNHGPYSQVRLRFREAPDLGALLARMAQWMRSRTDHRFRHHASELFDAMFRPFDATIINFLKDWLDMADAEDVRAIAKIIREAETNTVLEKPDFVVQLLQRAKTFGGDVLEDVSSDLYASAISGMRSGTAGEPFPQDIKMKADAEKALADIPRFSPAFELYQSIRERADDNIKRQHKQGEAFED